MNQIIKDFYLFILLYTGVLGFWGHRKKVEVSLLLPVLKRYLYLIKSTVLFEVSGLTDWMNLALFLLFLLLLPASLLTSFESALASRNKHNQEVHDNSDSYDSHTHPANVRTVVASDLRELERT